MHLEATWPQWNIHIFVDPSEEPSDLDPETRWNGFKLISWVPGIGETGGWRSEGCSNTLTFVDGVNQLNNHGLDPGERWRSQRFDLRGASQSISVKMMKQLDLCEVQQPDPGVHPSILSIRHLTGSKVTCCVRCLSSWIEFLLLRQSEFPRQQPMKLHHQSVWVLDIDKQCYGNNLL